MADHEVTVLIPCHKTALLEGTIASVLNQTYPVSKVIVIADGIDKPDWWYDPGAKLDPRVWVEKNGKRLGKAASINRAMDLVHTDLVLLVDADTYMAGNALDWMVGCLGKEVKVVIPTLYPSRKVTWIERGRDELYQREQGKFRSPIGLIGCCILARSDLLRRHPIPEDTMVEDQAWAGELEDAGVGVYQARYAACFTEEPRTAKELFRQLVRWNYGDFQMAAKKKRSADLIPFVLFGMVSFGVVGLALSGLFPLFGVIGGFLLFYGIMTAASKDRNPGGRITMVQTAALLYASALRATFRKPEW